METNNEEEKQLLYESINNDIIEKIYLFHRKIELKNLMKTFEKFIKILGLHETFNQDCDKLRNILSGNNLLNNYEEMKNILSKWDINLLNQKQDYENILNELFTKEQLMIFIKDKKEEDINSLQELIDPSQSLIITNTDIKQLANIIVVKDKLVELVNNENLLKEFSTFISEKYDKEELQNLLRDIRKSTENIREIIDIYTKKLDKNVFAEKRFNAISENGIFEIIFRKNIGYVCTVTFDKIEDEDYKIKEENKVEEVKIKTRQKDKFEEIIGDKDLLLLVKSEESKEKKELKDKMIKIVENIQLILEKLSIIMNKGYDEDEYNKIQIFLERENLQEQKEFYIIKESYIIFNKKGGIKLENNKKEPKQINQLISILETIHKEQIAKEFNIYLEVPQSRYIYGNQFNKIYK